MKILFSIGVIVSIVLIACNNNETETDNSTLSSESTVSQAPTTETSAPSDNVTLVKHAEAKIAGTYPDTTVDGTIKFDADSAGKVTMSLEITIPKKAGKSVAVHIHEHGNCGDTASLAHDHWNPTNAQHGKWGSSRFHSGDIGNIKLSPQGKGTLSITTDLWTLGGKPDKNILSKAVIVHGGMDDYKSQPAGNSGTRIGCGVIQ